MTLEIVHGLVLVCGPVATGKTTLAKRIMGESPRSTKVLVNFPEILLDSRNGGNMMGDAGLKARIDYMHMIFQAYNNNSFIVSDGSYLSKEGMHSFLYRLRMTRITCPVSIIKLFPEPELHAKYMSTRTGEPISADIVAQQYHEFENITQYNFQENVSWVKREYLVKDPEDVELKFL